ARPDYRTLEVAAAAQRPAAGGPPTDWPNLQMRLRLLLADPRGADWIARLRALRDEALVLVARQPDRALLRLVHDAGPDSKESSGSHSLLVCVLVALSAPQVPGWDAQRDEPLTLAALSMNVSINALQDELARQQDGPTPAQRSALDVHAARSAGILES